MTAPLALPTLPRAYYARGVFPSAPEEIPRFLRTELSAIQRALATADLRDTRSVVAATMFTALDATVVADATDGAFSVLLPPVRANAGRVYTLRKIDASANAVTLSGNGALIDGAATRALSAQYDTITVQSDGLSWQVLAATAVGITNGDKGDITVSGTGGSTWTIDAGAVTYAKMQNVAANSFLANVTGSAATVQEIATSRIPLFASAITGTPSGTTFLRGDGQWATPGGGGSGDVSGPASATDNAIALFSGTTGKLLKNSLVTIGTTGAMAIAAGSTTDALIVTTTGSNKVSIRHDASNRLDIAVSSTGSPTFNAFGTNPVINFQDNVQLNDSSLNVAANERATPFIVSSDNSTSAFTLASFQQSSTRASGTSATMTGVNQTFNVLSGSATYTTIRGYWSQISKSATGAVYGDVIAYDVNPISVSATATYGLRVGNITGATTNYAIYTNSGIVRFGALTGTGTRVVAANASGELVVSALTTLAGYGITDAQPLDATLTALAGLDSATGLVEQTGVDAFTKRAIGVAASTDIPTRADADARYAAASHTHGLASLTDFGAAGGYIRSNGSAWVRVGSLDWGDVTSRPTTIGGYGITDFVSLGNAEWVQLDGSYSDPSWITALAGSKVSGNITGSAANVTGIVAVANGGTSQSTWPTTGDTERLVVYDRIAGQFDVAPNGSSGQFLTVSGGAPTWATPPNVTGSTAGYAPSGAGNGATYYLNATGAWSIPTGPSTYSASAITNGTFSGTTYAFTNGFTTPEVRNIAAGALTIGTTDAQSLIFNTNSTARLTVSSAGAWTFASAALSGITTLDMSSTLTVSAGGITVTGASTITGTLGGITTLTATTFSGSGSALTNLQADALTAGTVPNPARLGTGGGATNQFLRWASATSPVWAVPATFTSTDPGYAPASGGGTSNFLRADGTWAVPSAGSVSASNVTGGTISVPGPGTFSGAFYKFLNDLTIDGTLTATLTGNASSVTNGVYTTGSYSNPAWITALAWSKISGITGTPDGTKFLRDDATWQAIPAQPTITDDTTTNATRYILFDDVTSGSLGSALVSSTKLTYNPSTGRLSSTISTVSTVEAATLNLTTSSASGFGTATSTYTTSGDYFYYTYDLNASGQNSILRMRNSNAGGVSSIEVAAGASGARGRFTMNASTGECYFGTFSSNNFGLVTGSNARWWVNTAGNLYPASNNAYDLGTSTAKVKTGYFATSIIIGTDPGGTSMFRVGGGALLSGAVGINTTPADSAMFDVNGKIRAGTASSTSGSVVLQGQYSSGAIAVWATNYSSGGPIMGYGIKPSLATTNAFLSSSGVALTRGAYTVDGSTHRWFTGASQTVAVDSAVTMTERMSLSEAGALVVSSTVTATDFVLA